MNQNKPRILVVDDEPGMLRAVERILSGENDIVCTQSAADALQLAQQSRFDLAICDIAMPRMDGFELLAKLKEQRPDLDVIIMTGMSDPDVHMVRAIREQAFYFIEKPFNRDVMRTLVERCLELRRLREERRAHRARIDHELAEARALQQTMLPPTSASVHGIEIVARCVACSELGGDIYDYAQAGEGCAAIMVADVAGHGLSAALLTALVKSAFASSARDRFEPLAVVRRVARNISHFSPRRFVTLFAGRIDRNAGRIEFVNAGHPPPLMWCGSSVPQPLEVTGPLISPVLGLDEWTQSSAVLPDYARVLLYTDGVTDAGRQHNGLQLVVDQIKEHPGGGAELLDAILANARAAGGNGQQMQVDDFTLLTASVAR